MVIFQLVPRCTAAIAALVGRVILAEMFTTSIIDRAVGVFHLWGKKGTRGTRSWKARVTGRWSGKMTSWFKWATADSGFGMTAAGFNGTRALQTSNRSWSRIRRWGNWEPRDYWLGRQTGEQKILTEYKSDGGKRWWHMVYVLLIKYTMQHFSREDIVTVMTIKYCSGLFFPLYYKKNKEKKRKEKKVTSIPFYKNIRNSKTQISQTSIPFPWQHKLHFALDKHR